MQLDAKKKCFRMSAHEKNLSMGKIFFVLPSVFFCRIIGKFRLRNDRALSFVLAEAPVADYLPPMCSE